MTENLRELASENDKANSDITEYLGTFSAIWMTLIAPIIVGIFISHWFSLPKGETIKPVVIVFAAIFTIVHLFLSYLEIKSKKRNHTHGEVTIVYDKYNEQVSTYNRLRDVYDYNCSLNISQKTATYLVSNELDKAVGELSKYLSSSPLPLVDSEEVLLEKHLNDLLWPLIVDKGSLFDYEESSLYNIALYVYNDESDKLDVKMRFHDERIRIQNRSWSPGMGHVGMAFLHKEIKCCPDIEQSTELSSKSEHDYKTYRSFISVPIIACEDNESTEARPHGVLVLTSAKENQFELQRDQMFLLTISKLFSIYLDKYEHTKKMISLLNHNEKREPENEKNDHTS
ncbi:GAF domain-containing protein [Photobacterium leiognathi]|uniref:GAF domain-containing protein n=1 Tax=Photobacterium leiognathi TaxID=553611 RepID=UPI000D15C2F6|nr:GAF domain-containing protein [Photobacterium leiognathi]PSW57085.1 hypothetical protein C0W50_10220 [Photobacterium leiognathi subsp. mandapamensis]